VNIPRLFEHPDVQCPYRHQFWKDNRWLVDWVEGDLDQVLKKKEAHFLLLPPEQTNALKSKFRVFSLSVEQLGFFDSAVFENNEYRPQAQYGAILKNFIVHIGKNLDIKKLCYVAGAGPWVRLSVHVAFQLGYRNFVLVDSNQQSAIENLAEISRSCFPINIKTVEPQALTLEPNNGSLLISCQALLEGSELLETLLYLNFVRSPGLICDLHFQPALSPLLVEGTHTGFDVVSGFDLRALYDYYVLTSTKVDTGISWKTYLTNWRAFLGLL
jgi:hypothetical protein